MFYRGDLDDQVVTADNGARVNRAYAAFVADGPWAEVKTWEVTPRIHTITGYGIANHTFVEGESGLIMIDTGQNMGAGLEALKMKQAFSDKPVVAVIYSHHHYTRGTQAVAQSYPDIDIPIFGHPDVDENMRALFLLLGARPVSARIHSVWPLSSQRKGLTPSTASRNPRSRTPP